MITFYTTVGTLMRTKEGIIISQKGKDYLLTKQEEVLWLILANDIIQSNPIPSKRKLRFDMSEIELKRYAVEENIDYDIIVKRFPNRKVMIDEIVGLIVEVLCSKRETITIASDTHPIEQVKKRFESIDSGHIEYILECLDKNTSDIRNIKQYLLSVIFNAPQTMDNYYTAVVKHDLYG